MYGVPYLYSSSKVMLGTLWRSDGKEPMRGISQGAWTSNTIKSSEIIHPYLTIFHLPRVSTKHKGTAFLAMTIL